MVSKNQFIISRCHHGPVEVIENLFCGSADEALVMASELIRVDTLVPLFSLDADIWELGFRGEILYYPINDFGVLPDDVLNSLVAKILDRLSLRKKVGLFCMGGHGRTGYVASVVLGKLGFKDPIQLLRTNYCKEAVESTAQIRHIAKTLGKPELVKRYAASQNVSTIREFSWDSFDLTESYHDVDYCFNCGEPLILSGRRGIPERCPVCSEIIEWI